MSVDTAFSLCNPKKLALVEKLVDMEEYPINVIVKAGLYVEAIIEIISERITLKGEGIDVTKIRNDIYAF